MKLAQFKNIDGAWITVWEQHANGTDPLPADYIRISEYVDVEFPPLQRAEVVAKEVAALDGQIANVTQEFAQKLDGLKQRRAEMLALTCDSEAA